MTTAGLSTDRLLLLAAAAAGLIFFVVPTIEVFRRPGFSLQRHAISMLSLGDGGWIMKAVFIASGILVLACALGASRALSGGLAAPLLIAGYGIGLVLAGLFDAPAGLGFPPGTPDDQQPVMTTGATLHSVGFMVAYAALIAACFVLAFHFMRAGDGPMAVFSAAVGILLPATIVLGVRMVIAPGIAFYWAAMLGWAWLAIAVLHLPAET